MSSKGQNQNQGHPSGLAVNFIAAILSKLDRLFSLTSLGFDPLRGAAGFRTRVQRKYPMAFYVLSNHISFRQCTRLTTGQYIAYPLNFACLSRHLDRLATWL